MMPEITIKKFCAGSYDIFFGKRELRIKKYRDEKHWFVMRSTDIIATAPTFADAKRLATEILKRKNKGGKK